MFQISMAMFDDVVEVSDSGDDDDEVLVLSERLAKTSKELNPVEERRLLHHLDLNPNVSVRIKVLGRVGKGTVMTQCSVISNGKLIKKKLLESNKIFEIATEPPQDLVKFISDQIQEKEKELECPVCLDSASPPIFSCTRQHLVCQGYRPRLKWCPECREPYQEVLLRHRYAERAAEELQSLKEKKMMLLADLEV